MISLLRTIAGCYVEGASGSLHVAIPDRRVGSTLGERGGGSGAVGGSDGCTGFEAIEREVLREMWARHGGRTEWQRARAGGVVGVAALQALGSTGPEVQKQELRPVGLLEANAKWQVAMQCR